MSLTYAQASRLFAEARRLFDVACAAYSRTDGTLDSAPILQKSLYVATGLLLRLGGATPGGYDDTVRAAQQINAQVGLLSEDISFPLRVLAEASARQAATDSDDADLTSLRQRYREVYLWAPDLLRAIEVVMRRQFARDPALFDKQGWRVPAQAFVATRAALLLVGDVGLRLAPTRHPPATGHPLGTWLEAWIRWDAAWFYSIVVRGYDAVGTADAPNVVFFPLFPLLAGILSWPLQWFTDPESAYYKAAMLLANAAFLFGLVGLRRLGTRLMGTRAADRGTWLLALFPFSFFFSAPYPQSLFLALSVWTVVLAVEERWLWAASLASLSGVTVQHGLILPIVLAILHRRAGARPAAERPALLPILGVACAAPAALMTYFATRYHNPFVFVHEYFASWGGTVGLRQWGFAGSFIMHDPPLSKGLPFLWNMALVPIVAILSVAVWRKHGPAYGAFCAVPALVGTFITVAGFGRFVAATFPLFLWAGWRVRDRAAFAIVCGVFAPTLAYFTYVFCHWGPTGGP